MDSPDRKKNLPRLDREAYRGLATVHWVFNIRDRKTGWLDREFFLQFQVVALHAFSRYQLLSPCIVLMPDHIHLLMMGFSETSDQRTAVSFLRRNLKPLLGPDFALQKTPFDHVLRAAQRKQQAFAAMAKYIRNNPWRANLLENENDRWEFESCLIPGYPDLEIGQEDFWERFWKIYYYLLEKQKTE